MALAIDTLLPTPHGWTSVYDLTTNSILFDELGYPCRVVHVSDPYTADSYILKAGWGKQTTPDKVGIVGSANQGIRTFAYHSFQKLAELPIFIKTAEITSLPEMPKTWPVFSRADIPRTARSGRKAKPLAKTHNLENLSSDIFYQRTKIYTSLKHSVPIGFPLQIKPRKFPLDPWIVGVLCNYYKGDHLKLNKMTFPFFRDRFATYGFELDPEPAKKATNPYTILRLHIPDIEQLMKDIDFDGTAIPPQYLRGSVEERMRLLSGLMDQYDEKVHKARRRSVNYYTTNAVLARQVVELVRSLGYPARTSRNNVNGVSVSWHPLTGPWTMEKLKQRYNIMTTRVGNNLERFVWKIYSCEEVGKRTVRDIVIDSPHGLFLVSEMFLPMESDHG